MKSPLLNKLKWQLLRYVQKHFHGVCVSWKEQRVVVTISQRRGKKREKSFKLSRRRRSSQERFVKQLENQNP